MEKSIHDIIKHFSFCVAERNKVIELWNNTIIMTVS